MFCLGTVLKTIKKYEINPVRTDISFVNEVLGCLQKTNNSYIEKLNKSDVSKILSCKRNVPEYLKVDINEISVQEKLVSNLYLYVKDNLISNSHNKLEFDVMHLCDKTNKLQLVIYDKLSSYINESVKSDTDSKEENYILSKFLSIAIIEAIQISNKIDSDFLLKKHANSELRLHTGDIFKFGFNRKNKDKNIVVIPVNTGFDTHISRKFEGCVKQVVSIKTLHGMWIERMMRRSYTKEKVDSKWIFQNEQVLKQRILDDLETRSVQIEYTDEYSLGTIAVIEEEDTIFYLLAASKFDENNNAYASKKEIESVIESLAYFYNCNGQGFNMYLPLIGTGMSRTGYTVQESFNKICEVFNPENNIYVGKVTIVVLPEISDTLDFGD